MDELKKLFEAIAQEKTRNLKLEEEKVLKQVEKTQKRQAHKEQVKEDFWGVFTSELKKLSEQEEEAQDKLGRLKEIKEQFVEATPHLYQESVEEEIQESAPDFFKDIDPQKMASEFDIRPVSQMTEDMSTTSQPYELIDHPTEVKSVPQSHVEKTFVIPEEDKTGKLDPDIAALEAKVNKLELKYAGVIEDEPTLEPTPEPVIESKDSYSTVMDVLSLKPVEKKDKVERQLQELAVQYLSDKKQSVQEQVDETASVQKQINEINTNIRQLILGMQGIGGGGEVRLEFLDDIDRSTAKVNNKFLMYDSTIEKWKGVDAHEESGLDRVSSHIIPKTDDTYDLGTSSLRWRDLYVSGSTVDIGGMKLTNDGSNNLEVKDSGGAKKTISANIAFSDISSKPTTVSGYGISDALSLTSLSVGSEASASGDGGISYNNSTGVFTYTPPDLSSYATASSVSNVTNESKATMFTSAALTGTPTAPTASTGTNTTQIATTAFVKAEIDALKALLYAYDQS